MAGCASQLLKGQTYFFVNHGRGQNFLSRVNIRNRKKNGGRDFCLIEAVAFAESSFDKISVNGAFEIMLGHGDQNAVFFYLGVELLQVKDFERVQIKRGTLVEEFLNDFLMR